MSNDIGIGSAVGALAGFYTALSNYGDNPNATDATGAATPQTTSSTGWHTKGDQPPPNVFTNTAPSYRSDKNASADTEDASTLANYVLKMAEDNGDFMKDPSDRPGTAETAAGILSAHAGELSTPAQSKFLKDFLGGIGPAQAMQAFIYGAVYMEPGQMAKALNNSGMNQNDMDLFVNELATHGSSNREGVERFTCDVLSQASPEVQRMFFESAKVYAHRHLDTKEGQMMAACAMKSLSYLAYTSEKGADGKPLNSLYELERLSSGYLKGLTTAAMQGEAAFKDKRLDGVETLMSDKAAADKSGVTYKDRTVKDIQADMFEGAMIPLNNSVHALTKKPDSRDDLDMVSFYSKNTKMKNGLISAFIDSDNKILSDYMNTNATSGVKNNSLKSDGVNSLRNFFAYAVFTPPPGKKAAAAVQLVTNCLDNYINKATGPDNPEMTSEDQKNGVLLGEVVAAMQNGLDDAANFAKSQASKLSTGDEWVKVFSDVIGPTLAELAGTTIGTIATGNPGGAVLGGTAGAFVGGVISKYGDDYLNKIKDQQTQEALDKLKKNKDVAAALNNNNNNINNKNSVYDLFGRIDQFGNSNAFYQSINSSYTTALDIAQ